MLVLSRKLYEKIYIGDNIVVSVEKIEGTTTVRLGFEAPPEVRILRSELVPQKQAPTLVYWWEKPGLRRGTFASQTTSGVNVSDVFQVTPGVRTPDANVDAHWTRLRGQSDNVYHVAGTTVFSSLEDALAKRS